jgi:hypothetical protein
VVAALALDLTVLYFALPSCPLSQRSRPPEIPGANLVTPAYPEPFLSLARRHGVRISPYVVVLSPAGQTLYRGRIDDRVVSLGKSRPAATREDLRIAIEEILAGKPVSVPETPAVGCAITDPPRAPRKGPSFARRIAPILHAHCVECHRAGGDAPFPLVNYSDAAPRAGIIARVAAERLMPPWLPEPNHFQNERRLSLSQIATLNRWAEAGSPAGDPRDLKPPPRFPSGWRLGEPDLVAGMPQAFPVPASGPDLYQCVVIPTALDRDRYVRAFEFRPGAKAATHHSLIFLDVSGAARTRDKESPGVGYPCFGVPGFFPSGSLGGWTPGNTPVTYPPGAAVVLRKGADIVLQVHYHPTGTAQEDRSELALYFQDASPARPMMDVALGSRAIDIPPGETRYVVRDRFTIPIEVDATGIIPHAHFIAREMRGWATLPGGRRIDLLTIKDWDFNWQQHYRWVKQIRLPAETVVEMEFIYDNSAANPRNPFNPPRRIEWGPESTDEMAGLHLQVLPVRKEDAAELGRALWGKLMREREINSRTK